MEEKSGELVEKFLRYMEIEKGASVHTLRAYRTDLTLFFNEWKVRPEEVELSDVRAFTAFLVNKGLKKSSVGRMLSTLRSFFKFLNREGHMDANPARLMRSPKPEKKLPGFLTVDEAFGLMEIPGNSGFMALRDRAMLELLYSSGLRVGELSALDMDDLSLKEGMCKVRGKGKKERLVPVGGKAVSALRAYILERFLLKRTLTGKGRRQAAGGAEKKLKWGPFHQQVRAEADRTVHKARRGWMRRKGVFRQKGHPPHLKAYVRFSSVAVRGGPQGDTGASWPFQPLHYAKVHAPGHCAPDGCIR